jgi:hypothetical protein
MHHKIGARDAMECGWAIDPENEFRMTGEEAWLL